MAKKIHDGCVVVRNVAIRKRNITDVQFTKKLNGTVLCESNRHVPILLVRPYRGASKKHRNSFEAGVEIERGVFSFYTASTPGRAFEIAAQKYWK